MTISRLRTALYVGALVLIGGAAIVFVPSDRKAIVHVDGGAQQRLHLAITDTGVTQETDYLKLGKRIVFSTAAYREREEKAIVLSNRTSSDIRIRSLHLEGSSPKSFALGAEQPVRIDIPAHHDDLVRLRFTPQRVGVVSARLNIELENGSPISVELGGYNAEDFEGGFEPNLQEIFDALGYRVNVAMPPVAPPEVTVPEEDRGNSIGTGSTPIGDEIVAPYFRAADTAQPVQLIPVAAYVSRGGDALGPFGIFVPRDEAKKQTVLSLRGGTDDWGGENQQLQPGLGNGDYDALSPGTITFTPAGEFATFGVWDGSRDNFSDDNLNMVTKETGKPGHIFRVYPAKNGAGEPIANSYLLALDSGSPDYRNFDYQDFVFLLSNVVPA